MPRGFVARQEYHIRARSASVFRALTEPSHLVKWFLSAAKLTPRKGGLFAFDWSQGYHMDGRVLRYERPRSVTFLWVDRLPSGRTVQTRAAFTIRSEAGGSILSLRHTGFRDPKHFAECSARWAYYLTNLKSVLEHRTDLRSDLDW